MDAPVQFAQRALDRQDGFFQVAKLRHGIVLPHQLTPQRIEHGGRSNMICVSAAARAQIEPNRKTRSLGVTGIKGKGELELFEVLPADASE